MGMGLLPTRRYWLYLYIAFLEEAKPTILQNRLEGVRPMASENELKSITYNLKNGKFVFEKGGVYFDLYLNQVEEMEKLCKSIVDDCYHRPSADSELVDTLLSMIEDIVRTIHPSNYGHDLVCAMNNGLIEIYGYLKALQAKPILDIAVNADLYVTSDSDKAGLTIAGQEEQKEYEFFSDGIVTHNIDFVVEDSRSPFKDVHTAPESVLSHDEIVEIAKSWKTVDEINIESAIPELDDELIKKLEALMLKGDEYNHTLMEAIKTIRAIQTNDKGE